MALWNGFSGAVVNGSSESAESAHHLLNFMADNLPNQYVNCSTRKQSTLDLFSPMMKEELLEHPEGSKKKDVISIEG